MLIARPLGPSELAWPPTCAFFVHRLHRALAILIRQAERYGAGRTGYPEAIGEKRLWEAVFGVEQFLHMWGIEQDYQNFRDVLLEALPWLRNVLSELPDFDRGNPPVEAKTHARWLVSGDRLDSLRTILELTPDPFDCDKGASLQLFEWARHNLGTEDEDWNFANNDQIPDWFWRSWRRAPYDSEAQEFRPAGESLNIRKRLLVKAGLLTAVAADTPTTNELERKPSIDEIRAVVDALKFYFIRVSGSHYNCPWQQENHFYPWYCAMADALRPLRAHTDEFRRWPFRVAVEITALIELFDELQTEWGWRKLDVPEPERSALLSRLDELFEINYAAPRFEAAISWQEGGRALPCGDHVDAVAEEGRRRGYSATLIPEQGKARFSDAERAWDRALRLGTRVPSLDETNSEDRPRYEAMCRASNRLESALKEVEISLSPLLETPTAGKPAFANPIEPALSKPSTEAGVSKSLKAPKFTKDEEIVEIRKYVIECQQKGREPNIRDAAERIRRSLPYTSKLPPVRRFVEAKEHAKSGSMGHAISLSDDRLAAASKGIRSRAAGVEFEAREKEFLATASKCEQEFYGGLHNPEDKVGFLTVAPEQRAELVRLRAEQEADERQRKIQPG
jgi:hypothetical protein